MKTTADSAAPPTERYRWLDRWLEPRWRALLTWVALAVATTLVYRQSVLATIQSGIEFVHARLLTRSANSETISVDRGCGRFTLQVISPCHEL